MKPFSVLMSVYYKEKPDYLRQSLESIYCQTLPPNEVILVEDGKIGDLLNEVIDSFENKYSSLKRIRLCKNVGLGKALNEGLKHCSYEIVARMDSDDECYPNRFERQIQFMEEHPDIDVVGSLTTEFCDDENGNKKIMSLKHFPETIEDNISYSRKRCPVEHPAVVFRKEAVLQSGGYMHCPLFEDYHLWVRMFMKGFRFYNIQEPLLFFRMSKDSYERRGGWYYAVNEIKSLVLFLKIGFYNYWQFFFAVITRFPVRILPNPIRKYVYVRFLRKYDD